MATDVKVFTFATYKSILAISVMVGDQNQGYVIMMDIIYNFILLYYYNIVQDLVKPCYNTRSNKTTNFSYRRLFLLNNLAPKSMELYASNYELHKLIKTALADFRIEVRGTFRL